MNQVRAWGGVSRDVASTGFTRSTWLRPEPIGPLTDALFDYLGGGVDDAEHVVDVAVAERIGEHTTGAEAGTRLEQ